MRLVGCVQHLSGRPCYCMGRLQGWGGASDEIYDGNARAFFAAVRDVRAIFFRRGSEGVKPMAKPTLTISSRNYSSWRSEEHTSELQSLMRISYAVFCLKQKQ